MNTVHTKSMQHNNSTKIITSYIPLQKNKSYDECESNNNSIKSATSGIHDYTASSENGNDCTSVEQVNKYFKELKIAPYTDKNKLETKMQEHLAGKITKIIPALATVLIQPVSSDILLCLGSPLFLKGTFVEYDKTGNYILFGHVDDIFGSIGDPMYAVKIYNSSEALSLGQYVYYVLNDSTTELMYVQHIPGNNYDKVKYSVKIRNL